MSAPVTKETRGVRLSDESIVDHFDVHVFSTGRAWVFFASADHTYHRDIPRAKLVEVRDAITAVLDATEITPLQPASPSGERPQPETETTPR